VAVLVAVALTALVLGKGDDRPRPASSNGRGGTGAPGAPQGSASTSAAPSDGAAPGAPSTDAQTASARSALQAFIRGFGNGDPTVCDRYGTDLFADGAFGSMEKCRAEVRNITERYTPENVRAMRTMRVPKGTLENGHVVVHFSDLRWTSGYVTSAIMEERFELALVDGEWRLIH
jgi:hypothetical protein